MPQLLIPNLDPTVLDLLRQRAADRAHSVEFEAEAILVDALRPVSVNDPWGPVNAMREELARSGREFPDSTPLVREDRDR